MAPSPKPYDALGYIRDQQQKRYRILLSSTFYFVCSILLLVMTHYMFHRLPQIILSAFRFIGTLGIMVSGFIFLINYLKTPETLSKFNLKEDQRQLLGLKSKQMGRGSTNLEPPQTLQFSEKKKKDMSKIALNFSPSKAHLKTQQKTPTSDTGIQLSPSSPQANRFNTSYGPASPYSPYHHLNSSSGYSPRSPNPLNHSQQVGFQTDSLSSSGNWNQQANGLRYSGNQMGPSNNSSMMYGSPSQAMYQSPSPQSLHSSFQSPYSQNMKDAPFPEETDPMFTFTYQPSPTPASSSKNSEFQFGMANYFQSKEILDKLGISDDVNEWIQRMQYWFGAYILQPLSSQMMECEKNGLSLEHPVPAYSSGSLWQGSSTTSNNLFSPSTSSFNFGGGSTTSSLWGNNNNNNNSANQQQNAQQERANYLTKLRQSVEKYLSITECQSRMRTLLVKRIHLLSDKFVPNYQGTYTDPSPTSLPSDTTILMHLFATFIDQNTQEGVFARFIVDTKPKSEHDVVLVVKKRVPLHYEVWACGENWPAREGKLNIFHALVLWILAMKTYKSGFFPGGISMGVPNINLLAVIGAEK